MRHRKDSRPWLSRARSQSPPSRSTAQAMPPDLPGDQVRALQEAGEERSCRHGEDDPAGQLAQAADSRV